MRNIFSFLFVFWETNSATNCIISIHSVHCKTMNQETECQSRNLKWRKKAFDYCKQDCAESYVHAPIGKLIYCKFLLFYIYLVSANLLICNIYLL